MKNYFRAKILDPSDSFTEVEFKDYLNLNKKPIKIFKYKYKAGDAFFDVDPIAFRQMHIEYLDRQETQYICIICGEINKYEDKAHECCSATTEETLDKKLKKNLSGYPKIDAESNYTKENIFSCKAFCEIVTPDTITSITTGTLFFEIKEESAEEYTVCDNTKANWSTETERAIEKYNAAYREENPGNDEGVIDLEQLKEDILERIQEAIS